LPKWSTGVPRQPSRGPRASAEPRPRPDGRFGVKPQRRPDPPLHLSGPDGPLQGVVAETLVRAEPDRDLEHLYREQGPRLWRALVAYAGDPEIANDAVAEAFAQALGRGNELRNPLRWVWRVAFRVAAGDLKERRRRGSGQADRSTEADDSEVDLLDALRQISPRQRAALVLHYYVGHPTKEIAAILGSSGATVRVHLSQGRRRLRRILEEQGD